MTFEFVITPMQSWQFLLIVCGAIITIGGAIKIVKGWISDAKKPKKKLKSDLDKLEETVENHEEYLKNDKESIEALKKGQHIMFRSHLALISHAIDGNNTKELKEVKSELQQYLIERK